MDDHWRTAMRNLLECLADLDIEQVLFLDPPGGDRWSQIIRKPREFLAEVQSNHYLADSGLAWDERQLHILRQLGWHDPAVTADEADAGNSGSPNHFGVFGLEEAADLARALLGVYAGALDMQPSEQLLASYGSTTRDLFTGEHLSPAPTPPAYFVPSGADAPEPTDPTKGA